MYEEVFNDLGLTSAETKVYTSLLKTGITTAGPLLDETKLQNSTLHKTLNKLVTKGFTSFTIKGKIRYYRAAEPEFLLKVQKERENRLLKLIPVLKQMQVPVQKQKAEIFEGFRGLKNMLYEMISNAKKGDEYLFFAFYTKDPDKNDNVYNFYKEFEDERWRRGIKVRGIAPSSIKSKFKGRRIENVKFVDIPIPMNIGIINDKIMFTPWEDSEISIMIQSKQLSDSFRNYFNLIWSTTSKDN